MDFNLTAMPQGGQVMNTVVDLNKLCNQYASQGGAILAQLKFALVVSLLVMIYTVLEAVSAVRSSEVSSKGKIVAVVISGSSCLAFLLLLIVTIKLYVVS